MALKSGIEARALLSFAAQNQRRLAMRTLLLLLFFALCGPMLNAQVFMRPFDNAAAMGMGGATIAYPLWSAGVSNDAQLGLGKKLGLWAGSAIPYGLTDWQTAHLQAVVGVGKSSGIGLDLAHSSTDVYSEQRFRLLYGRRLGEKLYLGGSVDALRASAQEYGSATSATFSLSLLVQALPKVWVGGKIQNPFQQKIGDDLVPTVLRVGAAWQPTSIFLVSFETEKDLERPAAAKVGIEYRPNETLFVRTGVRAGQVARIGFGAGLRLKSGLSLAVSSEWHPSLGLTPAAMVAWEK
jgi:hypothetical protein